MEDGRSSTDHLCNFAAGPLDEYHLVSSHFIPPSFHLQESIDAKSQWFHTVAWTVPSILTIVVLIMKKVEGDVLSGACFVGLWDHVALLWFVIVPLAVCLALGAVLLIVGLSSLVKVISLFIPVC